MRTANPALNTNAFKAVRRLDAATSMTINGTVNRTFILLFLLVMSANFVWQRAAQASGLMILGLIGGFIVAMVTVFKKEWAPVTAPVYALLEGLALGGISAIFEMQYPGIVIQAVFLTFATLFSLLFAYKSGLIKVSENFKLGVVAATGGIALVYFATIILGFFGVSIPFIHSSGPIGIGFSLFVVVIAALNLVLDFDFIEQGSKLGAPKYMEWYGAFGLTVTLIWLYIEILRLLVKSRRR
ncbi:MAG: Bax inhibitor-1/YccA family protein [Candidatus Omnitrophica bacterium]|nr:Bax inhibitor-1/YccA family protein [Candidatus Omnitrophota bacterium]